MVRTNKYNYIKQKSTHRVLFSSFLYGARLRSVYKELHADCETGC